MVEVQLERCFVTFLVINYREFIYPQLACIACPGLSIPFSIADCKRAFSTMKLKKSASQNRLKITMLDCLFRISKEGPDLNDFHSELALNKWSTIRNGKILQNKFLLLLLHDDVTC